LAPVSVLVWEPARDALPGLVAPVLDVPTEQAAPRVPDVPPEQEQVAPLVPDAPPPEQAVLPVPDVPPVPVWLGV
jgi:hypothetical protein